MLASPAPRPEVLPATLEPMQRAAVGRPPVGCAQPARRGAIEVGRALTLAVVSALLLGVVGIDLGAHPSVAAGEPTAPSVAWARQTGGLGVDTSAGVAVTAAGRTVWVGGITGQATFGVGSGAIARSATPSKGAFVAAHDPTGDLRWVHVLDGGLVDAWSVAARPDGGVVVVGAHIGPVAFDGTALVTPTDLRRRLLALALSEDGHVEWVRSIGGPSATAVGRAVAVGGDGTVVVTGELTGQIDAGAPGAPVPLLSTSLTPWLAAFAPDGTTRWATTLPTSGLALAMAIDVGPDGGVVAGGLLAGTLTPGGTASPVSSVGAPDGWLVALGPTGEGRWSVAVGDEGMSMVRGLAVAPDGSVAVAAPAIGLSTAFGTSVPPGGQTDAVIASLDGVDGSLRWLGGLLGPGIDGFLDVATGSDGGVTAVGARSSGATAWSDGAPIGPGTPDVGIAVTRWDAAGALVDDGTLPGVSGLAIDGPPGQEVVVGPLSGTLVIDGRSLRDRGRGDALLIQLGPPTNRPPVVADQWLPATPDRPRPVTLAGDDPDGDALRWEISSVPASGAVAGTPPSLTYHPTPGTTGVDSFEVTADDGRGGRTTRTVHIDVGANRLPILTVADTSTTSGQPVEIPVDAVDPDGDPVTRLVVQGPTNGSLVTTSDPWVLRPRPGWTGTEQLVVAATDSLGGTTEATLTVTVVAPGANQPPRYVPTPAATTIAGRAVGVEVAVEDPDGDPVAVTLVGQPALGTAALEGTTLTYTPTGSLGTDVVALTATDTRGGSTAIEVVVHVKRPNVVVVMTDDQTLEQLRWMTRTQALVGANGTTFRDAVVSYSECCPSRATLLTGRYAHNHGVLSSAPPTGGIGSFDDRSTLATWLDGAGYDTLLAGKYLNGYGTTVPPTYVPPGWDDWLSLAEPAAYAYLGGRLSDRGAVVDVPGNAESYTTDLLADRVVEQITAHEASASPFFALYAPIGPHVADDLGEAIPAPRHQGSLPQATAPAAPPSTRSTSPTSPRRCASDPG